MVVFFLCFFGGEMWLKIVQGRVVGYIQHSNEASYRSDSKEIYLPNYMSKESQSLLRCNKYHIWL